ARRQRLASPFSDNSERSSCTTRPYSASVCSFTTTPTRSDKMISLVSPACGVTSTGRPAAQYSPVLVGDPPCSLSPWDKKCIPTCLRASSAGPPSSGTVSIDQQSDTSPTPVKSDVTNYPFDIVSTRKFHRGNH